MNLITLHKVIFTQGTYHHEDSTLRASPPLASSSSNIKYDGVHIKSVGFERSISEDTVVLGMNILNLAFSNFCNVCTNLANGINTYTHDTCRSVSWGPPWHGFDVDILWRGNEAFVERLIDECDLLHLNSWYFVDSPLLLNLLNHVPLSVLRGLDALQSRFNELDVFPNILNIFWYYRMRSMNKYRVDAKDVVLQYHGSDLRKVLSEADKRSITKRKFKVLVSVPDILPQLERAQWLPVPVPTDHELYTPLQKRDDSVIKIVHAPSRKEIKKTGVLINAVEALRKKYDVELVLIENMPHKECLKLKRICHISFDNIGFGSYGVCSVEAICHEQPTLVYLNDVSQEEIRRVSKEIGVEAPFINIGDPKQPSIEYLNKVMDGKARNIGTKKDFRSVYDNLERLIVDSDLRKEIGKRGRKWARLVHDEKVVAGKVIEIYES